MRYILRHISRYAPENVSCRQINIQRNLLELFFSTGLRTGVAVFLFLTSISRYEIHFPGGKKDNCPDKQHPIWCFLHGFLKMAGEYKEKLEPYLKVVEEVTTDLKDYYPEAVLLFGSLARWLEGHHSEVLPNDIDFLIVCNSRPFAVENRDYGIPVELNRLMVDQAIAIARSLRYDSKPVALSKLYSKNVIKQHSIDVIAASILLGRGYNEFGIEQIEIDGKADKRDYSMHRVLVGEKWWQRLAAYASERRGPWNRFVDRMLLSDKFQA
jgi:predicted nucleotidyltransferase